MAKQLLDDPEVGSLLEQVGGEAVPEEMRIHLFLDARLSRRLLDNSLYGRGRELSASLGREDRAFRGEAAEAGQVRREAVRDLHEPVLLPLCELDMDEAFPEIKAGFLQVDDLRDSQPAAVEHLEDEPVFGIACGEDHPPHLVRSQDHRDLFFPFWPGDAGLQAQNLPEEELQGGSVMRDRGRRMALQELPEVLFGSVLIKLPRVAEKEPHRSQVASDSLSRIVPQLKLPPKRLKIPHTRRQPTSV